MCAEVEQENTNKKRWGDLRDVVAMTQVNKRLQEAFEHRHRTSSDAAADDKDVLPLPVSWCEHALK